MKERGMTITQLNAKKEVPYVQRSVNELLSIRFFPVNVDRLTLEFSLCTRPYDSILTYAEI